MASEFLTPLRVEKTGPQTWRLLEPLMFSSEYLKGLYVAPAGFDTNFASIPRPLWALFPPVDDYDYAATIHDAAYARALQTGSGQRIHLIKPFGDRLFYEGLRASRINVVKARLMFSLVSVFGDMQEADARRRAARLPRYA